MSEIAVVRMVRMVPMRFDGGFPVSFRGFPRLFSLARHARPPVNPQRCVIFLLRIQSSNRETIAKKAGDWIRRAPWQARTCRKCTRVYAYSIASGGGQGAEEHFQLI